MNSTPVTLLRRAGAAALLSAIALPVASTGYALTPMLGDVSINVDIGAPPPPRHEVIVERERPGPDYIWVAGYWDGAPGRYNWVAGHWERPPHAHATWVQPRWERDHDGHYHMIRGEWR